MKVKVKVKPLLLEHKLFFQAAGKFSFLRASHDAKPVSKYFT